MHTQKSAAAVNEYADLAKKQLFLAGINARIEIEKWKAGQKPDFSFTKDHKDKVGAKYAIARENLAARESDLDRLKDSYAFWTSSLEDLVPHTDETGSSYEKRIAEREFKFSVMANRLTLM